MNLPSLRGGVSMTAAPRMPLIPNVIVGGGAWGRLPGKGSGAARGWGLGDCGAPGGRLGFQTLQEVVAYPSCTLRPRSASVWGRSPWKRTHSTHPTPRTTPTPLTTPHTPQTHKTWPELLTLTGFFFPFPSSSICDGPDLALLFPTSLALAPPHSHRRLLLFPSSCLPRFPLAARGKRNR